jgi:hypothetical protein
MQRNTQFSLNASHFHFHHFWWVYPIFGYKTQSLPASHHHFGRSHDEGTCGEYKEHMVLQYLTSSCPAPDRIHDCSRRWCGTKEEG